MKTVLCYGDSNTWGCVQKTLARFPRCVRWTGVMAETLGAEYEAVEDGIGYALLRAKPIDLVVVMLGTNDLIFTDEEGYGHGISLLTERILHADLFCQGSSPIFCGLPRLLLVSPILMGEDMSYHRASCFRKNLGAVHGQMALDVVENGTEEYLLRTMRASNILISINSSRYAIMPRGSGYSAEGNRQMLEVSRRLDNVYMWLVVDPHEPETFDQAQAWAGERKILGLKIHPEEHEYTLEEFGDGLFALVSELRLPVLGHSGGICSMPEAYAKYAEKYPETVIIAAHLGSSPDGDPEHHTRAIRNCRSGNLYTDTSSAMSILAGLLEYAVSQIGPEHIFFGTDSWLYFSPGQRARVDEVEIPDSSKYNILRGNAERVFGLSRIPGE